MSEQTDVHIGENSPEQVAYKLMIAVGQAEKKLDRYCNPEGGADRDWILDTYVECINAVRTGYRKK